MAKICANCGATLSDEMIFCNKCGARYREGAPVPTAATAVPVYNTAPTAKPKAKKNLMWLVALVLAIVSFALFDAAPVVEMSTKEETETFSVFYFCSNDTIQDKAESENVDDEITTVKVVAIAATVVGVAAIVMMIMAMCGKTAVSFLSVIAQGIMVACGALIVFVLLKGPINDIVASDVSFTLSTWGWIFLCTGSFSIVTAIKAIQNQKA